MNPSGGRPKGGAFPNVRAPDIVITLLKIRLITCPHVRKREGGLVLRTSRGGLSESPGTPGRGVESSDYQNTYSTYPTDSEKGGPLDAG